MGKFTGFLLASDYDGTLAASDGSISEKVKNAIEYFISQGGYFTVCTGRSKQGFHAFDGNIMNAPVITANGGMLYDYNARKIVSTVEMSDKIKDFLKDVSKRFPFICIEMYSAKNNTFAFNLCPESRRHFEGQHIEYKEVYSFDEVEFPLVKLMFFVGKQNTLEVQQYLAKNIPDEIKYIPSYGDFVELLNKDTDKGRALLRLADTLGISRNRAFAVGDGSNDVDMLIAAEKGFVPENGDDFAKKSGDIIVKSNNDGAVADVIEQLEKMYAG